MTPIVGEVLTQIEAAEPKYGQKLRAQLSRMDDIFYTRAESFFGRYQNYIESQGKSLAFGVDCYLRLRLSMLKERVRFMRTGRYANQSFEDVNRRVYSNPETMQYHMHGLVFAQFLWPDQYKRFQFFCDRLPHYGSRIARYLEVGGGHALYITEAVRLLTPDVMFDLVDISASSIQLASGIAQEPRINYHHVDIFNYSGDSVYDFVTMGELIEHVEQPLDLLKRLRTLMHPEARAYITTPANAPTLDHIYLFRNAQEIRDILRAAGFSIEQEILQYGDDIPPEKAEEVKAALMYGALVKIA